MGLSLRLGAHPTACYRGSAALWVYQRRGSRVLRVPVHGCGEFPPRRHHPRKIQRGHALLRSARCRWLPAERRRLRLDERRVPGVAPCIAARDGQPPRQGTAHTFSAWSVAPGRRPCPKENAVGVGRRPCPLVRLCVLHVLKLLRGSAFALGIGGASHILVSLSKQVMGNGIVRIHAESMLERARRQLSFPFFLEHLPQQDI